MYQIPTQDGKWIQANRGEAIGNLWATFNMDFESSLGRVRISPRLLKNTDSDDDADLGIPIAFKRYTKGTDRWWAICGTNLFRTAGTDPTATFTKATSDDGGASSPPTDLTTISSDLEVFNDKLYVTDSSDINEYDGDTGAWVSDWWTGSSHLNQSALTDNVPHPIKLSIKRRILLIGDDNLVHTVDTNENVSAGRVVLPDEFQVVWIEPSKDGTWIGTRHKSSGEAKVFFWDESAENYNRGYGVESDITFAGIIKDGVPYIINRKGQLMAFSGSGFVEVAVLPVFERNEDWDNGSDIDTPPVHRNGMEIIDNKIHILLSNVIGNNIAGSGKQKENFPAGVWEFDKNRGLTHKYSVGETSGSPIYDYGNFIVTKTGALVKTENKDGKFLVGSNFTKTSHLVTDTGIFNMDKDYNVNKHGYFITIMFPASGFEDLFKDLLVSFRQMMNSGDEIVIKYRTTRDVNLQKWNIGEMGTWTDSNTFTSTNSGLANASVGDEIMILRGRGSGLCAHISTISKVGRTYTVSIDETFDQQSGTFYFLVNNWKKCATINTQSIERQGFLLDAPGTFIQLKVVMRNAAGGAAMVYQTPEIKKIVITNEPEWDI